MRILLGVLLLLLPLGGCATLDGARKDLHEVGKALQHAANDVGNDLHRKQDPR
jgi:predicted small secreted protein